MVNGVGRVIQQVSGAALAVNIGNSRNGVARRQPGVIGEVEAVAGLPADDVLDGVAVVRQAVGNP